MTDMDKAVDKNMHRLDEYYRSTMSSLEIKSKKLIKAGKSIINIGSLKLNWCVVL
jgi:hypothetical protein